MQFQMYSNTIGLAFAFISPCIPFLDCKIMMSVRRQQEVSSLIKEKLPEVGGRMNPSTSE